jgi:ribosome-associated protein
MTPEQVRQIAVDALEELKAVDLTVIDVSRLTSITDYMIIVSGTSDRHVRALVNNVIDKAGEHGLKPIGVEGERQAQWALVDLGDVVVHVMLPDVREFYQLEKLWGFGEERDSGRV